LKGGEGLAIVTPSKNETTGKNNDPRRILRRKSKDDAERGDKIRKTNTFQISPNGSIIRSGKELGS